ncbi:hypothetical protein H2248_003865 [Termitomyces sp. 'cryptogamus']|nr:hypothetical protein H2248_003865 [Termitomyces sp. 'cryptogamus']
MHIMLRGGAKLAREVDQRDLTWGSRKKALQPRVIRKGDIISDFSSLEDGTDLLHTNIRPSQKQTIILNEILRQKTLELGDVEVDVLDLQEEIHTRLYKFREIIQTREDKMNDVRFYKSILPPIRLLPPEMLPVVAIFHCTIETCAPLSEAWSPLGLSHVCRA